MALEWKDISRFSREDTAREPDCFQLDAGGLKITIVRNHIAYRGTDTIAISCTPWFDVRPLSATTFDAAKLEAVCLVLNKIDTFRAALLEII